MAEEITTSDTSTTQTTNQVAEENTVDITQQTQVTEDGQDNTNGNTDENSNNEQATETTEQTTTQPSVEELQAKLKEYEVREEEDKLLRERLGLQDIDQQTYNYMNLDQQIVNKGKQDYLRLCNEYGIDANPEKIDASVAELKQKDPYKGFEFERKFEQLGKSIEQSRQAVQQQNAYYEVNKFANDYGKILQASPALNNVMAQYVQSYGSNSPDMYNELKSVMDIIIPVCQEWYNAGKQNALQEKAKSDTSGVQGGVATANTTTYSAGQEFTREQISRMSPEEFAKNEKVIRQAMIEGKIR